MVRVKTFVDDDEFLTYSADGVMVATPTGSTGYNFSAGGPVVEATLPVMILTPVAPHFTIDRSIVVADDKVIRLVAQDKPAIIVADGQDIGSLDAGQFVEVRKSLRRFASSPRAASISRRASTRAFERVMLSLSCWSCTPTDWA